MTKERIEEIKQMQHKIVWIVKKIGCGNVTNNSFWVNEIMFYLNMLEESIEEPFQELEKCNNATDLSLKKFREIVWVVKKIGCANVANNLFWVNEIMFYLNMLQEYIKKLFQEYEDKIGIKKQDRKNFIVNLDDQLMGWIPIWVEKPKEFTIVNLFLEDDEIGWGYRNDDNIFFSHIEHLQYKRKVIAWRESNPDEQSIPDIELFWEPSPPKHQLFDLRFVPFSSFKPWKTGEYLLYDKETNTYKTIKINKSNLDCRIDNYDSYTHWALVREEK